jgi:Ca2+:H+ antiporter
VVFAVAKLKPDTHTLLSVAPVLVLASYFIGATPIDLRFWPGAVVMILIATLTASLVTNSGRSA